MVFVFSSLQVSIGSTKGTGRCHRPFPLKRFGVCAVCSCIPHNTALEPNLPQRTPIDIVSVWHRLGFFGSPRRRANRLNAKPLYGHDLLNFAVLSSVNPSLLTGVSRAALGSGLTGAGAGHSRAIPGGLPFPATLTGTVGAVLLFARVRITRCCRPTWLHGIPIDLWYGLAINLVSPGGPRRPAMRLNAKTLCGGRNAGINGSDCHQRGSS